ncbi:hypothetical protein EVAR_39995_1 [Eumeta japonica]|uniref:Uncharacterized protein n=1 Tax=Eumeta variegata TaxID=151549 RepID=A0A4C1ZRA7_EUMVA|nr:hypothetical protein EVAR_39995_1 [Eumeta japonica]
MSAQLLGFVFCRWVWVQGGGGVGLRRVRSGVLSALCRRLSRISARDGDRGLQHTERQKNNHIACSLRSPRRDLMKRDYDEILRNVNHSDIGQETDGSLAAIRGAPARPLDKSFKLLKAISLNFSIEPLTSAFPIIRAAGGGRHDETSIRYVAASSSL